MPPQLSVLIPARNEMFLQRTVEDVLEHSDPKLTEVIVVLDGAWPEHGLPPHERVTVIYRPKSIGQRAATNEAARVSRAEFVMKLDAHCSLDDGFDRKLLRRAATVPDDVLLVPRQYNLHAFDWVCVSPAGHRRYQGQSGECRECGAETTREIVWKPRRSRLTTSWRFDSDLHFQYWGEYARRCKGDLTETMSLLGACWFVSRARFWEIDGLDEGHGSWGQMGTELACKSWLSGGRVLVDHRTWFAHMFRTQGGDFGFPYSLQKRHTDAARAYSHKLWDGKGTWLGAKRPLSWMIEHFAPVPDWGEKPSSDRVGLALPKPLALPTLGGGEAKLEAGPTTATAKPITKGVVYYSDCRGDETILNAARAQLAKSVNGHQIVTSCLDVVPFGTTRIVHAKLDRGKLTMFRQILAGLELCEADVVFLAEHDVLYHPSHFDFVPSDPAKIHYNENVWKVDAKTGHALHYLCRQTSGLCAYRDVLLKHYRKRVEIVEKIGFSRNMGYEPGTHHRKGAVDNLDSEAWMSPFPNVDIRHGFNLTASRWKKEQFRDQRYTKGWTEADEVPGWGKTKGRFDEWLKEVRSF